MIEIDTASDYKDLLLRLKNFASGVGMGAEAWTVMRYSAPGGAGSTHELILRGPGLGATDQIFVGISTFENATADYFNWRLAGMTGFNNALAFGAQPGYMGNVFNSLWNSPIPYWFVANGRRIIIVAKISTFFVMTYLGFINQYPSPSQYPYPLLIGGNMAWSPEPALTDGSWRWSSGSVLNTNFPMAYFGSPVPVQENSVSCRLRTPNGVWKAFWTGQNGFYNDNDASGIWPYMQGMVNLQQNLGPGNQSPLLPIILHDNIPEVYGELDGVLATSGQAIASEDLITESGDDHLVVQNVMRTGRNNYCAVRLV
jgi:hypothetical protein